MSAFDIAKSSIMQHEGLRTLPYRDTVGKLTIGYGRNLDDRGISQDTAEQMLDEDMSIALSDAMDVYADAAAWDALSDARKAVLWEMSYQLGRKRLSGFTAFLAASRNGFHEAAANEMLKSKWAGQVPNRAMALSNRYRAG